MGGRRNSDLHRRQRDALRIVICKHTMTAAQPLASHIDGLVVAAVSLAEGVEWCEKKLGITPGQGGEHPLMGTHNRLFLIASSSFPMAYF